MSDRRNMVGMEIPSFPFTVEAGKISELAMAIGDGNSVYYESEKAREVGYRDIISSPTYGTVIDHWGSIDFMEMCSILKINPVMVLHGEQEYEYLGEINPGDEMTAVTVLSGLQEKKSMYLFILDTEYKNQRGETVLKCRRTVIERKTVEA